MALDSYVTKRLEDVVRSVEELREKLAEPEPEEEGS